MSACRAIPFPGDCYIELTLSMAYINMLWDARDIKFDFVGEATSAEVLTVRIDTPMDAIFAMAEPKEVGRTLILDRFNIHSDAGARATGISNLRMLAELAMERMDYDEIVIQGTARTTGSCPGRIPGRLRFTRRDVPSPRDEPS